MKNKLLNYLIIPILALSLVFSSTSCAPQSQTSQQVAAANIKISSYSVQAAEHSLRAAKDTFDLFFDLVHRNHDFLVSQKPESIFGQVYAFAVRMQVQAPAAMKRANAAKNAFKYNRTPDNQTSLNTIMATIMRYQSEVASNTTKLQAATP